MSQKRKKKQQKYFDLNGNRTQHMKICWDAAKVVFRGEIDKSWTPTLEKKFQIYDLRFDLKKLMKDEVKPKERECWSGEINK